MTGTLIDITAIALAGALFRAGVPTPSGPQAASLRWPLAGATLAVGVSILYGHLQAMPLAQGIRWLGLVAVSLMAGHLTGRGLGLQRRLGAWGGTLAGRIPRISPATGLPEGSWATLGILLALNPLTIPGALADGLQPMPWALAIKAVLDVVAVAAYGPRAPAGGILALIGVQAAWQGLWTALAFGLRSMPLPSGSVEALAGETGLLIVCTVPAVAGIRKANLADLLPSLVWAPVLAGLWTK